MSLFNNAYDTAKRLLDIVVAGAGLLLLAPVFIVIGSFVWMKMGRPILFRQIRPGINGKPFTLYKFRTMLATNGTGEAGDDDAERLTTLGRWLRATSLDELPELWNVVRGDMSLVGPRPLLMDYLPLYTDEQARRHEVRPGITGWAQVNGRNALSWAEKFEHDVWYVENRSVRVDLLILVRTLRDVITGRGVAQPGQVTAERFRGEVRG